MTVAPVLIARVRACWKRTMPAVGVLQNSREMMECASINQIERDNLVLMCFPSRSRLLMEQKYNRPLRKAVYMADLINFVIIYKSFI